MTEAAVEIRMTEWETCVPQPGSGLEGRALADSADRLIASELAKAELLEVTELRAGLAIVRDEHRLRGMMSFVPGFNPRNRRPPVPRPDFVIQHHDQLAAILDAKYRDLWEKPLPREMLYQLAIYAASHKQRSATILYPTTESGAQEARLSVQDPVFGRQIAQVNLRPVLLGLLESHVMAGNSASTQRDRRAYCKWLLFGG